MRRFQILTTALLFTVFCSLFTLSAGCGKAPEKSGEASASQPLSVYTVNYPLQYFAERIGGDLVEVKCPAPGDEDPAYWSPNAEVVTAYQQADLILLNGASYAKWVDKVSLPSSKLVDTSESSLDRLIPIEEVSTHAHGPEGKHAHGGMAFTTWLDLTLAIEQARAIKEVIAVNRPGSVAMLEENFAELEKDLLEIDGQLKELFSVDVKRPLVFSHPVYQYLERRYEVNGKSVHWEPDQAPTDDMLAELNELLSRHPAKWMVWEGTPDPSAVEKLKGMAVDSVVFDPCATAPTEGDFMSVMLGNIRELRRIYKKP